MSKTIEIKSVHIRNFILSILFGFCILYGLEHFGKFSYISENLNRNNYEKPSLMTQIPINTKVSKIYYTSLFNSRVETDGNGFDLYDVNYKGTEFNKYSTKSYYYSQATIKDYIYGVFISLIIFSITIFFKNFNIKFK